MDLTTIIPASDGAQANRLLKNLIAPKNVVLGIVVGNDDWCKNLIQDVDIVAQNRAEVRRSVWIQNPALVSDILNTLFSNSNRINIPSGQPYFFTVSLMTKVCDLILPGSSNFNISRIDDAFISAEIG